MPMQARRPRPPRQPGAPLPPTRGKIVHHAPDHIEDHDAQRFAMVSLVVMAVLLVAIVMELLR